MARAPYRALIQYRLDRAAEFLQMDAQCTVLEAALRCGFNDPGRFSRAFRQRFGRLPRELRRYGSIVLKSPRQHSGREP